MKKIVAQTVFHSQIKFFIFSGNENVTSSRYFWFCAELFYDFFVYRHITNCNANHVVITIFLDD